VLVAGVATFLKYRERSKLATPPKSAEIDFYEASHQFRRQYALSFGPIIDITATKLCSEYKDDPQKAEAKYIHRLLWVRGELMQLDFIDSTIPIAYISGDEYTLVVCEGNKKEQFVNLHIGQYLEVEGIVTKYNGKFPILSSCEVVR
jgi:hypothetical protein